MRKYLGAISVLGFLLTALIIEYTKINYCINNLGDNILAFFAAGLVVYVYWSITEDFNPLKK